MNYQIRSLERDRTMTAFAGDAIPLGLGQSGAPGHVMPARTPVVRSLEKRRLQCYLAMIAGDLLALLAGFALAGLIVQGSLLSFEAQRQLQLIVPIFLTIALYNGNYSIATLKFVTQSWSRVTKALLLAAGAVLLVAFFTKTGAFYSRLTFGTGVLASLAALVGVRWFMRKVTGWRCGAVVENVVVVEDGGPAIDIDGAYRIAAEDQGLRPDLADPHMQDLLGRWFAPMDRVIVSTSADKRADWALALKGVAVEGEIIDDTVASLGALGARQDGGRGLLLVSRRPLSLRERAVKRALDLAISLPALVLLSPLLIAVGVIIRLEDGGPAFFVQDRTGRASRFFRIFKFRSMRAERSDARGDISTGRRDSRVTRIGRFIRRTSIDELPQLLNVVIGDMSHSGVSKLTCTWLCAARLYSSVGLVS